VGRRLAGLHQVDQAGARTRARRLDREPGGQPGQLRLAPGDGDDIDPSEAEVEGVVGDQGLVSGE
jgi:hypothetical protein